MLRKGLLVGGALLLIVSCSSLRLEPLSAETRAVDKEESSEPLHRVLLKSEILTEAELKQVAQHVMPACARLLMLRAAKREVLVGYRKDATEPSVLASISRAGDAKGSLVLVVGLEIAERRITRVQTLAAKGKLYGFGAYQKAKAKFLKQFAGRRVDSDFKKVHAVTGATNLTKSLRTRIWAEAKVLAALKVQELLRGTATKS